MAVSVASFSENLQKLISKFEADKYHYLSRGYLESQARVDLITPFFKAPGWDVENEAGLPHYEREVIVEKGETEGRPDYNFRVAGQTKFFVEAKAPSEPLDSAKYILQANGYPWGLTRGEENANIVPGGPFFTLWSASALHKSSSVSS